MNLSRFSINRPVTILMLAIAVLIFGFVSLPKLAVELYPDLNVPVAVVVTSVEGSAPAEVEKLVTKPIEEALGTVANVKEITSNSAEGASQVIIQFNWGTDMDQATLDMRDKVDQVRGMLPDNANSPRILKFDPNSMPIITLAMTGDSDVQQLKKLADDVVKPRLERIDGVASVSVSGGKERVVDVVLQPDRIAAYGLSVDQVQQALMSTNISGTAGSVREGDNKLSIRVEGEFASVGQIGDTPIRVGSGSILLKNIAAINDTYKDVSQLTYLNNQPSVGLSITKATGGNTIEVADEVNRQLLEVQKELPKNVKITTISDSSIFIKDSIYTVGEHALVGGFFAIFVLLLFLNSVRSMLIVAIVIPISVISTFCLMYFTGQTINLFSLSGLTLGLGSLVDFAVVILENIFRQRQAGKSMLDAARVGSREVGTAVMASALAQIAVFLPIVFVEGLASELFGPLALTVVFSHIAALLASMTLVPMLSSRWLKRVDDLEHLDGATYKGYNPIVWFNIGFNKVSRGYGRLLGWSLSHRKTVLAATIALFVGSAMLVPLVGMEFIPKMDQGKISVNITMPNGTLLKETEKVVAQAEKIIKETPHIEQLYTSIGSSGGPEVLANATANKAQLQISLVPKEQRQESTEQVTEMLRQKLATIPGAEIEVKEADQSGGPQGAALQISLRGDDLDVLEDIGSIIAGEVKSVPGTRNVTTSLEEKNRELLVQVDAEKASLYGLTPSQVLSNVRTAFNGQTVTKYRTGEDEIDVRVMLPKQYQDDISYLKQLRIPTATGAQVALSSVATIKEELVPQTIMRSNQARQVTITGDIVGRDLGSISKDIEAKLNNLTLPDGYTVEIGGQSKDMAEAFGSLGFAIILAVVLVYMVMASQFESLFTPFVIMFSIPPTLIGVVVGLLVTHKSLSISALIGYILLVGIVVNNAIVLIDYVNNLRKGGMERNDAIKKAGPMRLRPILMTTLTTILAIAPLAFGGGSGNESNAPMAIVVIFGLSFSTMITLVLIPVVYSWFDDIGAKWRKRKEQRKAARNKEIATVS
ncbi:efflux RND transporter permease subunit [Brevibacillus sp. SYP-B805]|uniref:efflux RND transporter permease subunit n=1 Tax=Brevibacillus sp. SYP-B805 TaxID=1578199 RepID=UPI0013ED7BAD|nr:efflux RND transporter permease subunit [Brevibacillus sp. SYP-B805]NGQ96806.1 efflux RND transporter permease subunit [Brevibacillus sp. SYP-B805]